MPAPVRPADVAAPSPGGYCRFARRRRSGRDTLLAGHIEIAKPVSSAASIQDAKARAGQVPTTALWSNTHVRGGRPVQTVRRARRSTEHPRARGQATGGKPVLSRRAVHQANRYRLAECGLQLLFQHDVERQAAWPAVGNRLRRSEKTGRQGCAMQPRSANVLHDTLCMRAQDRQHEQPEGQRAHQQLKGEQGHEHPHQGVAKQAM